MTRKIAILGGGGGSLIAAWELVRTDPTAYDITVYQLGWRLGGKGASGRRMRDDSRPVDVYSWVRPWVPYGDDPFVWYDPAEDMKRPLAPATDVAPPIVAASTSRGESAT